MIAAWLEALYSERFYWWFAALSLVLIWELALPFRELGRRPARRWLSNIGLVLTNMAIGRLLLLLGIISASIATARADIGLIAWLDLSPFWGFVLGFIIADLGTFALHWASHKVPLLWRLHRVHHSDTEFDVTTGFRNHPFEALVGLPFGLALVVLFGIPPLAVIVHALLSLAMDSVTHANARMHPKFERVLRWLLVTSDMHRIHHSARRRETDSNYSMTFSVWDRLFGTYVAAPQGGQRGMKIGLEEFREPREQRIDQLLLNPFKNAASGAPAVGEKRPIG